MDWNVCRGPQKFQIVVAQHLPIQTVVSLSQHSSHAYPLTGTSQVVVLSCQNRYTPCPFLPKHILEKLLTQQLGFQSLILPLHKEMPTVGAVLAAALILLMFLSHLSLKFSVSRAILQVVLGVAYVKNFFHKDHLGVLVGL